MQKITPNLWFDHNAKQAIDYYMTVFPDGKIVSTTYYPTEGLEEFQQDLAGEVLTIEFEILGMRFVAINAGPEFTFNESVSFSIVCADQAEIDYYWDRLTSDGGMESQCGWCKDRYGLSWQVVPANMDALMTNQSAWNNMIQMKKIIIADLK